LTPPLYPGSIFVGLIRVILLSKNQKEALNQYVDKYILIDGAPKRIWNWKKVSALRKALFDLDQ
jgi:hypothetical protein